MTTLVRLYPRRWRDRYETEFLGLLEMRPPSARDRVDILLGALDARLHEEVPGSTTGPATVRRPARTLASLAAVAGASWLAWMTTLLLLFKGWGAGQPDFGVLIVTPVVAGLAMAVVHGALAKAAGDRTANTTAMVASVSCVAFGVGAVVGGPSLVVALIGSAVIAKDGIGGALPSWLRLGWIASVVAVIVAMLAFIGTDGTDVPLLAGAVPYGVVWLLIAVMLETRGIPEAIPPSAPGATPEPAAQP